LTTGWNTFTFGTPCAITAGTNYAIVVTANGLDASNYITLQDTLSGSLRGGRWNTNLTNALNWAGGFDLKLYEATNANVYGVSLATQANVVVLDGVVGSLKASPSLCVADGDFYPAAQGLLYIYSATAPSGRTIEAGQRDYGITMSAINYVTLQNFTTRYNYLAGFHAIGECDYITIDSCDFSYSGEFGIKADYIGNFVGWNIENNTVSYNPYGGMQLSYFNNGTVQNNNIHHNAAKTPVGTYTAGIHLAGPNSTTQACQNNIIQNNSVHDHTTTIGIWLDTALTGNIIRYNLVYNNYYGGILNEVTSGTQIYYNLCYNNVGHPGQASGIYIAGRADFDGDNNVVYNNVCYGNGKFGIIVQDADGIQGHCHNNVVQNNIAVGTVSGPNFRLGGGAQNEPNTIAYNCFGTEKANFIEWGWGIFLSTYADFETRYGGATYSVEADPLFVSTSTPDFHLQATSPAINAGTNVGLTRDYEGTAVPQGPAPDIGAYEYTSATPCIHKSDLPPCDGCISDAELSAFIDLWYVDSSNPSLKELMEAIGFWKRRGC
jgi:parallel beta-helix repeat protein